MEAPSEPCIHTTLLLPSHPLLFTFHHFSGCPFFFSFNVYTLCASHLLSPLLFYLFLYCTLACGKIEL